MSSPRYDDSKSVSPRSGSCSASPDDASASLQASQQTDSEEQLLDDALRDVQAKNNVRIFESQDMSHKRKSIIQEVEKLTTRWIQDSLRRDKSLPDSQIEQSSSYIVAFGSYELNVHFESSDIDLLCIGPRFITRKMLFEEFVELLRRDERVTDILQLQHAFVPLLKFTFEGIDIDLVYAQWNVDVIDADKKAEQIDLFSNTHVQEDTLFSLNGVRSTQTIKKLVPNRSRFEKTLRCIKFWAQQRALYSNVMGFLGGISWSIMTALICIENKDSSCVQLIKQFFATYQCYEPDCISIEHSLFDSLYDEKCDLPHMSYKRNPCTEIMPILTPARPAVNCAYNVIESTKQLILKELARAHKLTQNHANWSALFEKRHLVQEDGATEYDSESERVYIQIQCVPDGANRFGRQWSGFIESKIRNLVKKLNHNLVDSTFYPYAHAIKSGVVDHFFIVGQYNTEPQHWRDNQNTISSALDQFKSQIEHSGVAHSCQSLCTLQLEVVPQHRIRQLLHSLNGTGYPTTAPVSVTVGVATALPTLGSNAVTVQSTQHVLQALGMQLHHPQPFLLPYTMIPMIQYVAGAEPALGHGYHVPQLNHHHHVQQHNNNGARRQGKQGRRHYPAHPRVYRRAAPPMQHRQHHRSGGNSTQSGAPMYSQMAAANVTENAVQASVGASSPSCSSGDSHVNGNVGKPHKERDSDSVSNDSLEGSNPASTAASTETSLSASKPPSFGGNDRLQAAFPIVKIEQPSHPHMAPVVSAQNGRYSLIASNVQHGHHAHGHMQHNHHMNAHRHAHNHNYRSRNRNGNHNHHHAHNMHAQHNAHSQASYSQHNHAHGHHHGHGHGHDVKFAHSGSQSPAAWVIVPMQQYNGYAHT